MYKKKFYDPVFFMGFNCLKAADPLFETSYFLPINPWKILVVIWSTYEEWKPESTTEPSSDFEPKTGMVMQCPNH